MGDAERRQIQEWHSEIDGQLSGVGMKDRDGFTEARCSESCDILPLKVLYEQDGEGRLWCWWCIEAVIGVQGQEK